MKKLDNIEQLEALIKKNLDKAEVPAPTGVWESVAASSGIGSTSVISQLTTYFSSVTNLVKVALFAGGITTGAVLLYQANTPDSTEALEQAQTEVVQKNSLEETSSDDQGTVALSDDVQDTDRSLEEDNRQAITQSIETTSESTNPPDRVNDILRDAFESDRAVGEGFPQEGGTEGGPEKGDIAIVTPLGVTCLGDTRTFISQGHEAGNWYINGELVKRGSDVMSHVFNLPGEYRIMLEVEQSRVMIQVRVNDLLANIQSHELASGQIQYSIDQTELQVKRWMLNGQQISTAQTITPSLPVGKVKLTAEIADESCVYVVEKEVDVQENEEIIFSTAFSPNGDGSNDEYWVSIENYQSFYMVITTLAGERVFETNDPSEKWNGKVSNVGYDVKEGHYIVTVKYQVNGRMPKTKMTKLLLTR